MRKHKKQLKPIDTPNYRYWNALYLSFYSKNLYVDVGKRWRGFGLAYLLLVISLFSIPLAVKLGFIFNQTLEDQMMEPLRKVPLLYIQKGRLSFDEPMPYMIKNKQGQIVLIIDTTGKVNQIDNLYPNLNILINKEKIYFKMLTPVFFNSTNTIQSQGIPLEQSFDKNVSMVFDGKKIVTDKSILALKYISACLIYPIVVAVLFGIFFSMMLVIALLGQLFASVFFSFRITYKVACRLLTVSSTPMFLFLIGTLTLDLMFAWTGVILIVLMLIYYSLALSFLKAESRKVVSQ